VREKASRSEVQAHPRPAPANDHAPSVNRPAPSAARPARSAGDPALSRSQLAPGLLLALQRRAGNRAVVGGLRAHPVPAGAGAVVQRDFAVNATNVLDLLNEQDTYQKTAKSGADTAGYTTVGFEHEFAQMDKDGPFTGVSHVELATTKRELPLTGLPFHLETDADRALELVSPPFVVDTVAGTRIPQAGELRAMDNILQTRLKALVQKPTTVGGVVTGLEDDGLDFEVDSAKVKAENIGPETTGDFHTGNDTLPKDAVEAIKVKASHKGSADVTKQFVSTQANFATDLATYEKARAQAEPATEGYAAPFAALEAQLLTAFTASYDRLVLAPQQDNQVKRFLGIMALNLSGQLAVPSMEAAITTQKAIFEDTKVETRRQKRNKIKGGGADNVELNYHRKMSSHVKDAGPVWLKDNLFSVGLGLLPRNRWADVQQICQEVQLQAAINGLKSGAFFKGEEKKLYDDSFRAAKVLIIAALATLDERAGKFGKIRAGEALKTFPGPRERPSFLHHDPAYIGARQDTRLAGGKVQLPGHQGPRLHVIETRGEGLDAVDRLHMSHLMETTDKTDDEIREELGHEDASVVAAYRDKWIASLLGENQAVDVVAAAVHVPRDRVHRVKLQLSQKK
jgi:hypothetical protein